MSLRRGVCGCMACLELLAMLRSGWVGMVGLGLPPLVGWTESGGAIWAD